MTQVEQFKKLCDMMQELTKKASDDGNHDAVITFFRLLQEKPGVQTSEFLISMLATAAGIGMTFWPGHEIFGLALAAVADMTYVLSRTAIKRARIDGTNGKEETSAG